MVDQWTKYLVVVHLGSFKLILGKYLTIEQVRNRASAFSLIQWENPLVNQIFFLGIGLLALGLAFTYLWKYRMYPFLFYPLLCIISGAIGNLYDRVKIGAVIDFITVGFPGGPYWPTFNVADSLIVVGAGFLIFSVYKKGLYRKKET